MKDLKYLQIYNEYLPVNIFKKICDLAYKAKEDMNDDLTGNIEREYVLRAEEDPEINQYLMQISNNKLFADYHHYLSQLFASRKCKPVLAKTWVNFQQKNEFNPLHTHDGIFSFVIFVKIPYDCEDYKTKFPKTKPENIKVGMLSFQHIDPWVGRPMSVDISLNPKYEGGIYFFKSKHVHQVYPFYDTDEYRVTVSGNIHLL